MSSATKVRPPVPAAQPEPHGRRRPPTRRVLGIALVAVLAVLPLYFDAQWLQIGIFAFAAVIASLGLNLLVGVAGQLSLGHAFFVAIGAYTYSFLAGDAAGHAGGWGWPPLLAALCAVGAAGIAGAIFSPVAGRIQGIYLGVASLGLVFVGLHLIFNLTHVTGGAPGRSVPAMSILGFSFGDGGPDFSLLGVPFERLERLWYLALVLAVVTYVLSANLQAGRMGRGLKAMRDSEIAAAAMGVDVQRYKAMAFVLSSMYAGLAGIIMALGFSQIEPSSFGLAASIDYIAMVVIGGLGSMPGAVLGAVFVVVLPRLLDRFGGIIPFLSDQPAAGGVGPADLARYIYGALIVSVVLFRPRGLVTLAESRWRRRGKSADATGPGQGSA